jgi:hypothetical protein
MTLLSDLLRSSERLEMLQTNRNIHPRISIDEDTTDMVLRAFPRVPNKAHEGWLQKGVSADQI